MMVFDKLVDRRIRDAMSEGKFDHLPRRGAIDLDEYFKVPSDQRMGYSILKSAGFVPEEVELLREVDRLRNEIARATDKNALSSLRNALLATQLKLDLALERTRRQRASSDAPSAD